MSNVDKPHRNANVCDDLVTKTMSIPPTSGPSQTKPGQAYLAEDFTKFFDLNLQGCLALVSIGHILADLSDLSVQASVNDDTNGLSAGHVGSLIVFSNGDGVRLYRKEHVELVLVDGGSCNDAGVLVDADTLA